MTVSGYGYSAWGTSEWGGLSVGVIDFVRAFAAGDRIVLVELNYEPQHLGAQYPGDALNPASWTVVGPVRNAEGVITGTSDRVVASVEYVNATTYRLVTLFALGPATDTLTVSTVGLRNPVGAVQPDASISFDGCAQAPQLVAQRGTTGDLRNIQPQVLDNQVSGTLQVGSDGDYQLGTVEETVRKLIIRRLTIPKGGFTWLPDYGLDLPVKGLISPGQLPVIRDTIKNAVLRESEVVDCGVRVSLQGDGIVMVQIQARLRSGTSVNVATRVVAAA
jgi:hypothetical protein